MAAWGKIATEVSRTLLQRKCAATLAISFCTFLAMSEGYANILDPPIMNMPIDSIIISRHVVFEKTFEGSSFSLKNPSFFCPVTKKFHNDDEKVAIQTIILEAIGEGHQGMVAVGEVIRNRAKLFRKNFRTVCFMPKQFSCWNDRARAGQFLKEHRAYYSLALKAWKQSEKSRLTDGATDYHTSAIRPYWADAYRTVACIGNHIFYVRK